MEAEGKSNLNTSEASNTESVEDFFRKLEMLSLDESDKCKLDGSKTLTGIDSGIKNLETERQQVLVVLPNSVRYC